MIASGDVSASLGEVPILPMSRKWGNSKGMYTVIYPSGNPCRRFLFLLEWEDEMETWSGHTAGPEAVLLQAKADSWHWCGLLVHKHFLGVYAAQQPMPPIPSQYYPSFPCGLPYCLLSSLQPEFPILPISLYRNKSNLHSNPASLYSSGHKL